MQEPRTEEWSPLDISETDVVEAMKSITGYIDITPGDFKEIYQAAYALAIKRLVSTLKAGHIMTSPLFVLEPDMTLVQAAALLAEKKISGAPVADSEGKLVGVVSEKDFLKEMGFGATPSFMQIASHCLSNKSCMICRLHNKTIGDIMIRPPITGDPEMSIGAISALFAQRRINRLPIVEADGRPVGIVTRSDLAHSLNVLAERSKP
ncbi:CBS domain-containing protein [Desulfocastanea catecholica]